MDRRLFEAAWTRNVDYFLKLIEDDPCTLHVVTLAGGETPLHVACMAGHLDFIRVVLNLSHEFARDLNQNGLRPLDIASGNGHIEIVKELLKLDGDLCPLEGRERRIPLHYAVIKGRVDVITELLSASENSIANKTVRGETALHLAVKNSQFEAFKVLVEHLKQFNKEDVLNEKDDQGNTILHFAVSRKYYEVIDLVLNEDVVRRGTVEVNSLNRRALTPLDVLHLFQSEAGDREIEEILRRAGATRADDLQSSALVEITRDQVGNTNNPSHEQPRTNPALSRTQVTFDYFKYHNIRDSPSEVRNYLLVIATLVATATYTAVLSPPGGVWQDDTAFGNNNDTDTTTTTTTTAAPHTAEMSILASKARVFAGAILVFNSIGFFTSVYMIYSLTVGFPMRFELNISLIALSLTYFSCMAVLSPNPIFVLVVLLFLMTTVLMIIIGTILARDYLKWRRRL